LLKKLEINQEQFFNGVKNQMIKDELKKFTDNAFDKEVFGAPTFIVNNKVYWGQDRLEYALEELS
jgi:2-hydroxychromene-2-carboxylate isomerase